jgi:two-component system, LuxR family, sensor kinase FixL
MVKESAMSKFQRGNGAARVAPAALLIAAVALVDWRVDAPIAVGFLFIFPILIVGATLSRAAVVATALLCTVLADFFDPFPFTTATALPQDILVFTALCGAGLFAYEATRRREREIENLRRVEREAAARREAEEQLEFLIDSSPVAILTMTAGGTIVLANSAAEKLFCASASELHGVNVRRFLPALGRVYANGEPGAFRTEMQCRGERANGEVFLANVFFSTYNTAAGPRLAALVVDASEEMRDREESSLQQLMAGSRILVGAVSHEVRNVCGAIGVICENLARNGSLRGNKDFEALGALVETLHKIASLELKQSRTPAAGAAAIELAETLDNLRIVLEPFCRDAGIEVAWEIAPDLPAVWADPHSLLQVLLNLTKNSERALEKAAVKRVSISATASYGVVSIRVADTGTGIASADKLFQPFQKGAESTGLGLYLSRAFVRSFHGDLRYDPVESGCAFVIDLAAAGPEPERRISGARSVQHGTHTATVA